jgi:hypothetical protein
VHKSFRRARAFSGGVTRQRPAPCRPGRPALQSLLKRWIVRSVPIIVLAFPGNEPHSYANADAMTPARGVSVVVLAKAGA